MIVFLGIAYFFPEASLKDPPAKSIFLSPPLYNSIHSPSASSPSGLGIISLNFIAEKSMVILEEFVLALVLVLVLTELFELLALILDAEEFVLIGAAISAAAETACVKTFSAPAVRVAVHSKLSAPLLA